MSGVDWFGAAVTVVLKYSTLASENIGATATARPLASGPSTTLTFSSCTRRRASETARAGSRP